MSSFESACPGGLEWAWVGLGECIRSTRDKVSIAFGIASIIMWVLFGIPQIVENCRRKIPDSAMSVFLLLFWILGDSLNFIGGFLTGQLFLQACKLDIVLSQIFIKLLAGYTVFIDFVLFGQYLYYKLRRKHRQELEEWLDDDDEKFDMSEKPEPRSTKKGKALATILLGAVGISFISAGHLTSAERSPVHGSRQLFQMQTEDPWNKFLPVNF